MASLRREDGAEVRVVVAPPLSRAGEPSRAAADAIIAAGADAVVLDMDPSRQAFLSDSAPIPPRPTASAALSHGLFAQRFLQLQDDAMRLGLVPYESFRAARDAAESLGATVTLGGKPLSRVFERVPWFSAASCALGSSAAVAALSEATESADQRAQAERAFYLYDHPEMREAVLRRQTGDAQLAPGQARSLVGSGVYKACVVDTARVLVDAVRQVPEGRRSIVAVVPSETHAREFREQFAQAFDAAEAAGGGSFVDKYATPVLAVVGAGAVAAVVAARKPAAASRFTSAFARAAKQA